MEKKYIDILIGIREKSNPKKELNHIFIDRENMVVTDTRILVIYKHEIEDIDGEYLLLNPKAKDAIDFDKKDGFFEFGLDVLRRKRLDIEDNNNGGYPLNYPDYNRIVPTEKYTSFDNSCPGIEALYMICQKHSVAIDFIKFSKFFKKVDHVMFDKYHFTESSYPIAIKNDYLTLVIMPLVFPNMEAYYGETKQ